MHWLNPDTDRSSRSSSWPAWWPQLSGSAGRLLQSPQKTAGICTTVWSFRYSLRELLRSVAERFSGQTANGEQAPVGTIIGALLVAGGGIALAMTVDLSIGLQLADVARVRPWAVASAALGNAALVLGLSTAAESLYWV